MKIYAISGSLRKKSVNTATLEAVGSLIGAEHSYMICNLIGLLPLFNPDLEGSEPESVHIFRRQIKEADGLIISSPEYAHGVTGALKNALDWIVGSGEIVYKPLSILNVSSRATHADESMKEILKTMDGALIPECCTRIPLSDHRMTKEMILAHPEAVQILKASLERFILAIEQRKNSTLFDIH